ncbi:hypothetical protein J7F03_18345 [Streptomyces sp. ISL-43]|uniref:hypothetical protein n=1 Tax=Streptomyces sp. ISL-43 TaxID=2819183 RepID=UPI001BE59679|nr:hypothetical protein [Streptomyces sp. ISL-43]MBT2449021.1 hypothetical protein [Streptomyces sp. ISL-43]
MRAASRPDLTAAWGRVVALAERRGQDPEQVLAVDRLGHLSGVEPARIPRVLAGTAAELPLCERVHERFLRLRATRLDKHGREWPLAAIAEDFDAPGASLGPLNAGTGLPRLGHAAGVQRFFGVYAGFLLADSKSAVERALALTEPGSGSGSGSRSRAAGAGDDLEHLSYLTGITPQNIRLTLDGNPPRLPLKEQVRSRFEHLRRTRPREDGQAHSLSAIAGSFDASGQSLTRLAQGEGLPNLAAAAGIQRFYGVEGGFLLADDTEALAAALTGIERELRSAERPAENPMLAVMRAHDVHSIVTRAGRLSPAGWKSLADHLDDLLAREGQLARAAVPAARRADDRRTAGPRTDAAAADDGGTADKGAAAGAAVTDGHEAVDRTDHAGTAEGEAR